MIAAIVNPRTIPITPPTIERVIDSTMNCQTMFERRAPRAFLMPISRVRSVTETSMTFMRTIPPTTSEIDTMNMRALNIAFDIFSQSDMSCCEVEMLKSLFSSGRSPCRIRIAIVASSIACSMRRISAARTLMLIERREPYSLRNVVTGT